jgi:hypothetical protein
VTSVKQLVLGDQRQLGLDAFDGAGMIHRSARQAVHIGGEEQTPAPPPGSCAGEETPADVRVDRLGFHLQTGRDLGGREVMLVTRIRHGTLPWRLMLT